MGARFYNLTSMSAATIASVPVDIGRPIRPRFASPEWDSLYDAPRDEPGLLAKARRRILGGGVKQWVQNVLLSKRVASQRQSTDEYVTLNARLRRLTLGRKSSETDSMV
jgi:hypothetical protein